jgi:glycosyltransferase involved in cell wall biosynthesis
MQITIDARWLDTGLGTYTYNLLVELSKLSHGMSVNAVVHDSKADLVRPYCDSVITVKSHGYSAREQFEIPVAVHGCDLLHVPHYNVPLFYRGKLIVSIHDLIHLTPEGHNGRIDVWAYAAVMLRVAAWQADRIITVSDFTKRQLTERLGVPAWKIAVIPNGVSNQFGQTDRQEARALVCSELNRERRYFLCVSSLRAHKNVGLLLQAAALFWERTKFDWDLLIVGEGEERDSLRRQSERLRIDNKVVFLPFVRDSVLPHLYTAAEFFVMPSLLEGFGLPVVEAMSSGTPVVCSRAASLPEVGGDAALYFDPKSPESTAEAMCSVSSESVALILRKKGLEQAKRFSWSKSAQAHYDLYREVLCCA